MAKTSMTERMPRLLVATLVGALLLAGCGGSSEPVAKPVFVHKADAICRATVGEVLAKVAPLLKNQSTDRAGEATAAAKVLAPALHNEVDGIEALGAPSGEEDNVNTFLEATTDVAKRAETEADTAIQDPHLYSKAQSLAKRLDLHSCPFSA